MNTEIDFLARVDAFVDGVFRDRKCIAEVSEAQGAQFVEALREKARGHYSGKYSIEEVQEEGRNLIYQLQRISSENFERKFSYSENL